MIVLVQLVLWCPRYDRGAGKPMHSGESHETKELFRRKLNGVKI